MLLSPAQRIIIREVCSIQFTSLSDILIQTNLGIHKSGYSYEEILEDLGLNRHDLDIELIQTIEEFKVINKDPDKVFSLGELDMLVFRYILFNFSIKWVNRYPKAYTNLWNKLYLWEYTHDLIHKQ